MNYLNVIKLASINFALLYVIILLSIGIYIDNFILYSFIFLSIGIVHIASRFGKYTLLEIVILLALYTPFSITFSYIILGNLVDFGSGENSIRYYAMFNSQTVSTMLLVGILTVSSYYLSVNFLPPINRSVSINKSSNSPIIMQILLILMGLVFVTLSSRSSNIFIHTYGSESHTPIFAGGLVGGYVIWIYVYFREKLDRSRKLVLNIFWLIIIYHLIFQQVLVGSREFVGLMLGIFCVFTTFNNSKRQLLVALIMLGVGLLIMLALGAFRGAVSHSLEGVLLINLFNNNPWNSILLSVLGFADQAVIGHLMIKSYYWIELFYSLVPGFIYRLLDFPVLGISHSNEPGAWFSDYTGGGAYIGIRFFATLGFFGGSIFLFLLFCLLNSIDRIKSKGFKCYFIYLVVLISILRWFWYGDMEFLRALQMSFIILAASFFKMGGGDVKN